MEHLSENLEIHLEKIDHCQASCTDCGLCDAVCVTQLASGWAHEGPRGRIRLARAFRDGLIGPEDPALTSFDRCVSCGACERVCPEKVEYSSIQSSVQSLKLELLPQEPEKKGLWKKLFGRKRGEVEATSISPVVLKLADQLGVKKCSEQQIMEDAVQVLLEEDALQIADGVSAYLLSACYPRLEELVRLLERIKGLELAQDVTYQNVCCGATGKGDERERLLKWRREASGVWGKDRVVLIANERCRAGFGEGLRVMHVAELLFLGIS